MVIIISINGEISTNDVIRWLRKFNEKVIRINFGDFMNGNYNISVRMSNNNFLISFNGEEIDQDMLKNSSVWLRKLSRFFSINDAKNLKEKMPGISPHIEKEFNTFSNSLMYLLKDARFLCTVEAKDLNKMDVLKLAKEAGLKIPDTILTNSKVELSEYLKEHGKCITKCITDGISIGLGDDDYYFLSTSLLSQENLKNIPDFFVPSIVQNYIEKEFEIRIFYLDGQFFSVAIFSQQREHTKIDFRMIDKDKQSVRMTPFELPEEIKSKIRQLMKKLNLNTGSIDMIYTPQKEYYFLEVNPAGQYMWVDYYGNYYIDKHIAKFLSQKHESKT
jgi:ATP-GRASP peptide maturase of grasp-with-spasm system